ncbi:hypothetical protein ACFW04_014051 [Cataglyphis niger]
MASIYRRIPVSLTALIFLFYKKVRINVSSLSFSNISADKYSKIQNSISHPIDDKSKLFFFANGSHLIKNLRALINNKIITLLDYFKNYNKLSSGIVQFTHLEELVNEQENLLFMLAQNKQKYNNKTIALFIEIVSKWLITSRSPLMALKKTFLESIIDLFRDIEISKDKKFKLVHAGIMITTQFFIKLTKYLINDRRYLYVLMKTQNCIENLFSNIRKIFPIPNILQFKQSLKILSVSQYLQNMKNTSYEQDDGVFMFHFSLKTKRFCKTNISQIQEVPIIPFEAESKLIYLNNFE